MNDPKFVDIDGIKTRYFEKGTGPTLVLVHGGHFGQYTSAKIWNQNFDIFADNFHVYAFDRLGMGFTDKPNSDSEYTLTAINKHSSGFLSKLGLEKITLLGHSRGALVSTKLAEDNPDIISTLVLVDSRSLAPEELKGDRPNEISKIQEIRDRQRDTTKNATRDSAIMVIAALSFSQGQILNDQELKDEYYNVAKLPKTAQVAEKIKQIQKTVFDPDYNAEKKKTLQGIENRSLKAPTLITWGYNDPEAFLVPLGTELYGLISAAVPRSEMHVFNQAGHFPFREQPKDFCRVVKNFAL